MKRIAIEFGRLYQGPTFDGPTKLHITAIIARPKSMFRKIDPLGRFPAPVKPDDDNIEKLIFDALQRCRTCGAKRETDCECGTFWPVVSDDAVVTNNQTLKRRGAISNRALRIAEVPHLEIRISEDRE